MYRVPGPARIRPLAAAGGRFPFVPPRPGTRTTKLHTNDATTTGATEMSDVRPDYDFRDQEPLWVKYAEYTGDGSDKFYEVRIDLTDEGDFCLTKRWGARPDRGKGQIKPEYFTSMSRAMGEADGQLANKLRKGYQLVPRPYGASNQVRKETGPDYYSDDEAF